MKEGEGADPFLMLFFEKDTNGQLLLAFYCLQISQFKIGRVSLSLQ